MTHLYNPAVDVRTLDVRRSKRNVLREVSFRLERGTITGLLGPSGCGKTTLLRSIVGTQIIHSGSVSVLGRPAGAKDLRSRVGYVTQAPSVYKDLTVQQNVAYFGALYRKGAHDVARALDAVGLESHASAMTGELSGGQLGRVSLASALVAEPELLVLDEPTVGLDPVLRSDLWERFDAIAAAGTTLIVSSHVMEEAEHCTELLLMRDGTLLAQLTPDELRSSTGEPNLEHAFLALIRSRSTREATS